MADYTTREMLVRLEERIVAIQHEIRQIHKKIDENQDELKEEYVTKAEFAPVKKAVYAAIGFILTGFIGSLLALVFKVLP